MTTREEIREGIASTGYERMFDAKWVDLKSNSIELHLWLMVAATIMQYLHAQGVVIYNKEINEDKLFPTIEPLIKEISSGQPKMPK